MQRNKLRLISLVLAVFMAIGFMPAWRAGVSADASDATATIYFHPNGGTKGPNWKDEIEIDVPYEDVVAAPPSNFWTPPLGCEFDGFEIGGKKYEIGESYTITQDVGIKLLWKVMTCTITWDANGGTKGSSWVDSENVQAGTTIKLDKIGKEYITAPDGKEFSHFEVNGEKVFKGTEITISASTTIKYCWKTAMRIVKLTYDLNGGAPGPQFRESDTFDYGTVIDIDVPSEEYVIAPRGMKFEGFEIEGVLYKTGDQYTCTKDVMVKLIWVKDGPMLLDVKYDANGGTKGSKWVDGFQIREGMTLVLGELDPDFVTPPEGKEIDAYDINGVRYELYSEYTFTTDATIKFLWKDITVTPDPDKPGPLKPDPDPAKEPSFEDFIERMYLIALNRQSEPEGKAFWMDKVVNEGFTGGRVAIGFLIEAPEFLNRNLSDDEFVEVLYKTFFGRLADADGKAFWMGHLATDMTREQVVRGFIDSVEWCNLCATYGVKSGAPNAKAEKPSANALKFATRLYTECLGREPDADGLLFWALRLTNLESSGYEAAKGFFESTEFVGKNVDDETYVKLLYRTFMGRDYDQGGLEFWLGHLSTDMNRLQVLQGFAQSQEFTNICNQYGIDRGTI